MPSGLRMAYAIMDERGGEGVVLVPVDGVAVPTVVIVSAGGWIIATKSSADALGDRGQLNSVKAAISGLVIVPAVNVVAV